MKVRKEVKKRLEIEVGGKKYSLSKEGSCESCSFNHEDGCMIENYPEIDYVIRLSCITLEKDNEFLCWEEVI